VAGLYAADDVVSDLHQISVGTDHAATAATDIHRMLPSRRRGRPAMSRQAGTLRSIKL
jgi:thioredoxin reductase (NADPH)